MIYTDKGVPVEVLRIATPADVADAGLDPGVYRASRSPGRVTLLCQKQDDTTPDGGMQLAVIMDRLLGSRDGG